MKQPSTQIIAEAGVNHNGSRDTALSLVDLAADAGADVVKFQTFKAEKLATALAPKAAYQKRAGGGDETQLQMLKRLQLSPEDHRAIIDRCSSRGIEFLSTPFDSESLNLLIRDFELPRIKLGSGEITNGPLLWEVGCSGVAVILSTGMATLAEVETALGVLALAMTRPHIAPSRAHFESALTDPNTWSVLRSRVTLLHCTTEYPADVADTNLRAIDTMRASFGLPVGYSDHTEGCTVSVAAVARGAEVIEKHFTLDQSLPGPDHAASAGPDELLALVRAIRSVESALGSGIKQPCAAELANRAVARKSLVAARDLPAGHVLTSSDMAARRAGEGVCPMMFWEMVGSTLPVTCAEGDWLP